MQSSYQPKLFPVSVKGVFIKDGRVLLLLNERDEWELPGGKLDSDESPTECLVREIEEEVGWSTEIGTILDTWVYRVLPTVDVFIVTYGCHLRPNSGNPVVGNEHKEVGLFRREELSSLKMPEAYKSSVHHWYSISQ